MSQSSYAELFAASQLIGSTCAGVNAAFMKCKAADANPESCLEAGAAVKECVTNTMAKLAASPCAAAHQALAECLTSENMEIDRCRAAQKKYLDCAANLDK